MKIIARVLPIAIVLVALVACEHDNPVETDPPGDDPPEESMFSQIQTEIFNTNCALSGCHAGSNPQQGMDLSEGQAYAAIVGVPSTERPELMRVEPGNPDDSYLLMKIEGDPDIVGARMPLGRQPLSSSQISLVRDWIVAGAPED